MSRHPSPSRRGLQARRLFRRSGLLSPVALLLDSYLVKAGWFRSFRTGLSVDQNGEPLPWYTYAFTSFLDARLTPALRVFEYGAGMSSFWYAARAGEVVAVEHDPQWAATVRRKAPANCTVLLEPQPGLYVDTIIERGPFDIVVVDGLDRPRAAAAALGELKPDGVIVWDNSDWPEFAEVLPRLQQHGFRQLAFSGMGPISRQGWQTSVLYRAENCLGI